MNRAAGADNCALRRSAPSAPASALTREVEVLSRQTLSGL